MNHVSKIWMLLLAFVLCIPLNGIAQTDQGWSGSGTGTEADPYRIFDASDLDQMRNFLGQSGVYFKLMDNIDLTSWINDNNPTEGWQPIGIESSPFQGILDGNNKTISGLKINRGETNYIGLFGYVSKATFKNFTLNGSTIVGAYYTGTLVGCASGVTMSGIKVNFTSVKGQNYTGGLIGLCKTSAVSISSTNVNTSIITFTGKSNYYRGGIIGGASSATTITSCKQNGPVKGSQNCGGIIGYSTNTLTIKSTSSKGDVTGGGTNISNIGGLIGHSTKTVTVTSCSHEGNVTGSVGNIGGIIGLSEQTVSLTSTTSTGDVTGVDCVGGVVGQCDKATVTKCSSVGNIVGNAGVGGLVGKKIESGLRLVIDNSFAIGDVTGDTEIGGLVGKMELVNKIPYLNSSYEKAKLSVRSADTHYIHRGGSAGIGNLILGSPVYTSDRQQTGVVINIEYKKDGFYSSGVYYDYRLTVIESTNIDVKLSDADYSIDDDSAFPGYVIISKYYKGDNGGKYYTNTIGSTTKSANSFEYKYIVIPKLSSYYDYTFDGKNQIINSYFNGELVGNGQVGGLAGFAQSADIAKNYTSSTISGKTNVGGIVGRLDEGTSYDGNSTIKSNIAINPTVNASVSNAGRIYGSIGANWTVGTLGSAETNKALLTTAVSINGVAQTITESAQQGNTIGEATIKKKATYQGVGWEMTTDWNIQETESYPYKTWQTAPPVILSGATSGSTSITGKCVDSGTVYIEIGDNTYTANISGNSWTATVPALQAGTQIRVYAKDASKVKSYSTTSYVEYAGSGTESDPYQVYTVDDLVGMNGNYYYKLMNDLDLTSWISNNSSTNGWIPLGRNNSVAAHFDGGNHAISGLWINNTENYTGLFGNASSASIKNLNVAVANGKTVKGGAYTAILLGRGTNVTISNCSVTGNVTGGNYSASLVGELVSGSIDNALSKGSVTGTIYVGGMTGKSGAAINGCKSASTVKATSANAYVGGISGYVTKAVTKCSSTGSVTATGKDVMIGGIAGYSTAAITESVSEGSVTAENTGSYAGGIAGYKESGAITNCYSTATVSGTAYVGGVAAYSKVAITNCYASGNLKCTGWGAGIVGYNDGTNATIKKCLALSPIIELTGSNGTAKRVIGGYKNGAPDPVTTDNYALDEMILSVNGIPQIVSDNMLNGTSQTGSEFKKASFITGLNWNIETIWVVQEGKEYPKLRAFTQTPLDIDGIYYNVTSTSPLTVEVISNPDKYQGDIAIPQSVTYGGLTYTVTGIGASAFEDCVDLSSINLPSSLTTIGERAFRKCSKLTSVVIPNGVTAIPDYAFIFCDNLASVTIPNSVTSIGISAFSI